MEVHHPHHPTHKKKWSEYFLEFFMLFLAVTLGFFAENVREGISNSEKEKAMIVSLKDDLTKDTIQLNYLLKEYPEKINIWNDSIHYLIANKPIKGNEDLILQALNNSTVWQYYSAPAVALSLTESAESMNLIESKELKKQLLEYQRNEKHFQEYLKFIVSTFQQTDTAMLSITNIKTFRNMISKTTSSELFISEKNMPKDIVFTTYDKNIFNHHLRNIDHACMKINDLKTSYSLLLTNEKDILNTIKKQYHSVD
jgi:hypothetical protein